MNKIYEEYFSPVLFGGKCKVFLNDELLDEFNIPSPDSNAEKLSDSISRKTDFFNDSDEFEYEIEFLSSRSDLIVSIYVINQHEQFVEDQKVFRIEIENIYNNQIDEEAFNASYGMYAPPSEIPDFFSIRLSRSENIAELLELFSQKNTVTDLSIPWLSHYYKNLKIGSLVFIVAGGDKSVNRLDYKQGLYGIAVITQEPYGLENKKYTIDVRFIYFFEKILNADDLYPFENTKNIPYIGASTKGTKNQAISQITVIQASSVISASLSLNCISVEIVRKLLPWFYSFIPGNQKDATIIYDEFPTALNVDVLAKVFSKYIINFRADDSSTMIGIFGKWGRGKTSFYKKVKEILEKATEKENFFYFCVFQPWKYQEQESAWAYLYESILNTYIKHGETPTQTIFPCRYSCISKSWLCRKFFFGWQDKIEKIIHLNIHRNGKMSLVFFLSALLLIGVVLWLFIIDSNYFESVNTAVVLGLTGLTGIIAYLSKEFILKSFIGTAKTANHILNTYGKLHIYKNKLGFQNEIENEVKTLIKTFLPDKLNKKLIIFVDDLDRCNEKMLINIIDSLRLILEDDEVRKKIIIISAIDESILRKAVEHKYETDDKKAIETYIEKFFLFGIRLGRLNEDNIEELINLYTGTLNKRAEEIKNEQPDESQIIVSEEMDSSADKNAKTISSNNKNMKTSVLMNVSDQYKADLDTEEILNKEELQYITKKMKQLVDLTPRKINIYIQRYLFFKALAMELLPKHIFETIDSRIYINFVLNTDIEYFSLMYQQYKITHGQRIRIDIDGYSVEVSKTDFLKLLSIAEAVAPYSL